MAMSYLVKRALFEFWTGILVYLLAAWYVFKEFFFIRVTKRHLFKGDEIGRKNQVAIVTGGMTGIGLETVKRLLASGMHVIVGTPMHKEERLAFQKELEIEFPKSKIEAWYLDLSCLPSVKRFAERFSSSHLKLHVLINNAGIMYTPYEETEDGFELHFSVNFLGHALLTLLLLPHMSTESKANFARVVNVASSVHFCGSIDFNDLQCKKLYSRYYAYVHSKLCVITFTYALQRHLAKCSLNITANCLHPGVACTNLFQYVGWFTSYPCLGKTFLMSPKEASETTVFAALSPALEGVGGKYFEYCCVSNSSSNSRQQDVQDRLWDDTIRILRPWLTDETYQFLQICK